MASGEARAGEAADVAAYRAVELVYHSYLKRNAALGRLVEPAEIARTVAFLLSAEASAITGANVPVDCGWLAAMPWNTYGGPRPPGN